MSVEAQKAETTKEMRDPGADLGALRFRLPPYVIEVGPLGHLADERHALDTLEWDSFDAQPVGATIGAELRGIDLTADLSDAVVAELRRALLAYKVLFFRDQPLTAAGHVALARRFGDLEVHPFYPPNADQPELVQLAKSSQVGGYENSWHADVTWRERPSMGAILHALEVPARGGDTLFADMEAAYDGLDAQTKQQLDGRWAIHDYSLVFGLNLAPDEQARMRAAYPPARHPVVRRHPETGRQLLFLNRVFVRNIEGLDRQESVALIDELCRRADIPEYQCRFHWEPHSVAFWDNRAVQHYACSDYWPATRVMERASIVGDRPAA